MADMQETIASAVIVPKDVEETISQTPTTTLKRRQSTSSEDGSKRPRLSIHSDETAEPRNNTSTITAISPSTAQNPSSDRRKSKGGQEEEKKRGKRLFGALLGTLSQSSSSTTQKRRVEIEKKQQAKLREQADEDDEKKRRQYDDLMAARRVEQVKFDKQSMRIRHSNTLAMARFLRTKAEPRLYYIPWDMRAEEQEQIKKQVEETEAEIDKELESQQRNDEGPATIGGQLDGTNEDPDVLQDTMVTMVGSQEPTADESTTLTDSKTNPTAEQTYEVRDVEPVREDVEEHDEMVVEAGEDQVIY